MVYIVMETKDEGERKRRREGGGGVRDREREREEMMFTVADLCLILNDAYVIEHCKWRKKYI